MRRPSTRGAKPRRLPPEALRAVCDPAGLPFRTTAELEPLDEPMGQERATAALDFAIGMKSPGYNLFALGPEGTGKTTLIRRLLERVAAGQPVPDDWVYLHNFQTPHKPRAVRLPAGDGRRLRAALDEMVDELRQAIPAAFESDEYRHRRDRLDADFRGQRERLVAGLEARALERSVALTRTQSGLGFTPLRDGRALNQNEFADLPDDERRALETAIEELQHELQDQLDRLPQVARQERRQARELDRDTARAAIAPALAELRRGWVASPAVLAHLDAVEADVLANLDQFADPEPDGPEEGRAWATHTAPPPEFRRYRANLLGEEGERRGAPVVYEDNPTQPNLIGRIEHEPVRGAMVTDHTLIRMGALHGANGGYLILDAHKLLTLPFAWDDLKRALRSRAVAIETPGQSTGMLPSVTLAPEPIPLDLKVVLIGEPLLYYELAEHDPDFADLFKVAADFDWRVPRTRELEIGLARVIAGMVGREGLRPLDAPAMARVIEDASRQADDAEKLSTHLATLSDLVRSADHMASRERAAAIGARHVEQAIEAKLFRHDRVQANILEEIGRGILMIDTEGRAVGQINGLTVMQLGRFAFGHPARITCRVHLGRGELLDIEREVALGGPLHSKGVMILSSFLSARFAQSQPLALSASLVFEQSYGEVDGDSASSAELYCLMSALSGLPLRQDIAVTGAVDQHGRVLPIGGINQKVEGFFDLCRARGLTGRQGVMMPGSNARHLMLRRDVVQACADKRFHVYVAETIDQGIALLTGVEAGAPDRAGQYPVGSVNRLVAARLTQLWRLARQGMPEAPAPAEGRGRHEH